MGCHLNGPIHKKSINQCIDPEDQLKRKFYALWCDDESEMVIVSMIDKFNGVFEMKN